MTPDAVIETPLAPLLERFFTVRLLSQLRASPHTVAAYRDSFRLLLTFAAKRLERPPAKLLLTELDAPFVGAFLDHLEHDRHNSIRTRNARLAAIHAFYRYLAPLEPAHAGLIQRVLAIPQKRFERTVVTALTPPEKQALLAMPDRSTWTGRRDYALLGVAAQTGLRVSELCGLRREDVVLGPSSYIRCQGKGRKERGTPVQGEALAALRAWLDASGGDATAPVFPSQRGGPLGRDGVEALVRKYAARAQRACPSLPRSHITPHVLRHTAAVDLLRAGVDLSTIALFLGHEQADTAQIYLDADLTLKEQALARTAPTPAAARRYRPPDTLLAFLTSL